MTRSIFGWSYPPGCSGPPEWDGICELCGGNEDDCCCPECPVCGDAGNPDCYKNHGMVLTLEQKMMQCLDEIRRLDERIALIGMELDGTIERYTIGSIFDDE